MDGQPFFVVHQDVDPGLVKVLETLILPRLTEDIPGQPTPEALAADPLLHRFMVVFDREGYSPALMERMWQQRIAALTYRKCPGDDWPTEEFTPRKVRLVGGEVVTMQLAERGVFLGNLIWVREIRRLTATAHQTAIVTTRYRGDLTHIAAAIFARWCQENFFAYMRQHYGLDKLVSYGTEAVPDTTPLINPAYRRIDGEIRKKASRLQRMAHTLKEKMARQDDARALLRAIYTTAADLLPDEKAGTLAVRLHSMASWTHDAAVVHLCAEINETETVYPGTKLRLAYELVTSKNPGGKEI